MGIALPVHLAVHVLGLAVAAGLAAFALFQHRRDPSRIGLAFGALLLTASHVLVGGLWADPTGPVVLLRTAGYAALAVGAAGRLLGGGVGVVALLPPAGHLAAAAAASPAAAAVASARGVLGRGRGVLALAAGIGLWALSDFLQPTTPATANAASVLGSAAVGAWVLQRAGERSLAGRVAGSSVAVLLLLAVGLSGASGLVFSADLRAEQLQRLSAVASTQALDLDEAAPRELESTAVLLTGATLAAEVAAAGGEDALDARARTITELPGVDLAVLVADGGRVVGASLRGEPLGRTAAASIAGDERTSVALAGSTTRGVVELADGSLVAVGASPVAPRTDAGEILLDQRTGALVVGRSVSDDPVVRRIAADTGADTAIVVGGQVVSSTLPRGLDRAVLGVVGADGGPVELAGEQRLAAVAPLESGEGISVASLVLVLPPDAIVDAADAAVRSTFLVAVFGLLVAVGLSVLVARRVTEPVGALTGAAEQVAAGQLDTRVHVPRQDEVGRLAAAFGDMTTALAEREQALRSAAGTESALRARLEAVTASMGDALLAVDEDGTVTTANPAARALVGDIDPVGRPARALLRGSAEGGGRLYDALGGADRHDTVTVRGLSVDGERTLLATAAPLRDTGQAAPRGRVYVVRDISEQVRVERLKTEIIANVSHELRTPLTPIRGYLELLRHRELPTERVRDFATQAAEAAERMQRTVDSLIELADLEAGRTRVVLAPTSVDDVVGETLDRWRVREPDRRLVRRLQRGLPPVTVDPNLLQRVLDQLIDNAVKFSEGSVRLGAEQLDGHVRLTVRDDGVGIPPERLDRVLDDFEQADGSATRHVGGLGLGLSIVQRILQRLDAGLEIDSRVDHGTTVALRLPVAETEAER